MRYGIDYQYLKKGAPRPADDGEIIGIEATDESGVVVLPNVGDYVDIHDPDHEHRTFGGKVRSRLFRYVRTPEGDFCQVNIVVEETDDDWGMLIKE